MTITATVPKKAYIASGGAQFAYPFKISASTDLLVYVNTILTTTGFTIDGVGSATGGNVTFAVAPIIGTKITLIRQTTRNQGTDWTANDPDPAESKENAFDKAMGIAQEQDEIISRAPKFATFSSYKDVIFPDAVAGAYLRWNQAGTALELVTATGTIVSPPLATTYGINVRDPIYNAKGDGITDDGPAIANALALITAAGGGTLFFPRGNYLCSVALASSGIGITFAGEGEAATKITFTANVNALTMSGSSVQFRNMTIDGNNIAGKGITFTDVRDPLISYVDIVGFKDDAIDLAGVTQHVSFREVKISAGASALNSARCIRQRSTSTSLNLDGVLFQAGGSFTALTITAASNATPIQITTSVAHGLVTGQEVAILGVLGNKGANGHWIVTLVDATNFTLQGSFGTGVWTSGGIATKTDRYGVDLELVGDTTVLNGCIFDAGSPTAITTVGKLLDNGSYYQGATIISLSIEANNPVVINAQRTFQPNSITFKGSASRSNLSIVGETGNFSMINGQSLGVTLSPASMAADQNDYAPVDVSGVPGVYYATWRLNTTAGRIITGIADGVDGQTLRLINISSSVIYLRHQHTGSLAANRIVSFDLDDYLMRPTEIADLVYDGTISRWRLRDIHQSRMVISNGSLDVLSPAQIVANTNDYSPPNAFLTHIWRLNTDAARNLTGIAVSAVTPTASGAMSITGYLLTIINVGAFNLVVQNQNAGSAAGNRFITRTGADVTLTPELNMTFMYDVTTARWRAIA